MTIPSAIGYMGNKNWCIEHIKKSFGHRTWERFFDVFSGSFAVGINMNRSNQIICNDVNEPLIALYDLMSKLDLECIKKHLEQKISEFGLKDICEQGFKDLSDEYNKKPKENLLSILILGNCAYSDDVIFDGMRFKSSYGKNAFSTKHLQNIAAFHKKLSSIKSKLVFSSLDFEKLYKNVKIQADDLFYFDPPYLLTEAGYNRHWSTEKEIALYRMLTDIHKKGTHWVLSNVIEHKGKKNYLLDSFIRSSPKYRYFENVHQYSTVNSKSRISYHPTREIIVMNF